MTLHKITELYREVFSICPNKSSKFCTIAIFKSFMKQNNDSNKTWYVHDLFSTKLHLIKCSCLWVVSMQPNMKFNSQLPSTFVIWFFTKMVSLKVVNPLKAYRCTTFCDSTFSGASFASTSEIWTFAILKLLMVQDWKVCHVDVHVDGVRWCLWTLASNGPILHPAGDIWVWRAMVEWCSQKKIE
jgi:hypothetical protein